MIVNNVGVGTYRSASILGSLVLSCAVGMVFVGMVFVVVVSTDGSVINIADTGLVSEVVAAVQGGVVLTAGVCWVVPAWYVIVEGILVVDVVTGATVVVSSRTVEVGACVTLLD